MPSTIISGVYTGVVTPNYGALPAYVTIAATARVEAIGGKYGILLKFLGPDYTPYYGEIPTVTNYSSLQAPTYAGGARVDVGLFINWGTIIAGPGVYPAAGFGSGKDGSTGVSLAGGEVINLGKVSGGAGAKYGYGGEGFNQYAGTFLNFSSGQIIGGNGGIDDQGGYGMLFTGGTADNQGTIRGGNAGGVNSKATNNYGSFGGDGLLLDNQLVPAFNNGSAGQIIGGNGTIGGIGAEIISVNAVFPAAGFVNLGTITGGQGIDTGGVGLEIGSFAIAGSISNAGTVFGGAGGITGGAGVLDTGTLFFTNSGKITGAASSGQYVYGGDGINLAGGSVNNSGNITGGAGHYYGGTGVYIKNAGTIVDSSTISGGAGARTNGLAVQFQSGASRLVLDHGADLIGGASADAAVTNVIELGTGTGSLGNIGVLFDSTTKDSGITGFSSFAFDAGAAWTLAGTTTGFANVHISGIAAADTLDISGLAATLPETTNANSAGVLAIAENVSGVLDITFSGDGGDAFTLTSDGHGGTDISIIPCFCAGTRIRTPAGEAAVETLKIGDLILDVDGRAVPIRWAGTRVVAKRFGDPLRTLPIRIQAGALGENIPARDLLVSPDHAIFLHGMLVQAGALVNFHSITRAADAPEIFTYYHIETENHCLILAENAATETFIDNTGRMAFDNWAEHESLYGNAPAIAELPYARAKSQRQIPLHLHRHLAHRAAALGYRITAQA